MNFPRFKYLCGLFFSILLLFPEPLRSERFLRGVNFPALQIVGVNPLEAARLEHLLQTVDGEQSQRHTFLEDSLWILFQQLEKQGFKGSKITAIAFHNWQEIWRQNLSEFEELNITKDLSANVLRFEIFPGPQNYFAHLRISGIDVLSRRGQIQAFYPNLGIYMMPSERFFTEARLQQGIRRLQNQLEDRGFRQAQLSERDISHRGEKYDVTLVWNQGKLFRIRGMQIIIAATENGEENDSQCSQFPAMERQEFPESPLATADFIETRLQRLRKQFYDRGFANARFEYQLIANEERENEVFGELIFHVFPDLPLRIGEIELLQQCHIRPELLWNRIGISPGEPLNPDRVNEGRQKLSALGSFESIDVRYEKIPDDPSLRRIIYDLQQKPHDEISLRLGAGSYDSLRIGMDWQQNNLWGRGHSGLLSAVQSFKRTNLVYYYQIPEVFGPNTSLFLKPEYLRREETSFTRREKTLGIGLERIFPSGLYGAMQYQMENLHAQTDSNDLKFWKRQGNVGALKFSLERNRLQRSLYPTGGYRWAAQLEIANEVFGGNSEYERLELQFARHGFLNETLLFHLGLRHGIVYSFGDPSKKLPFNRRFFNGGPNSMRGFHQGQASPLDSDGNVIGASSFTLFNGELEQRLLNRISGFLFFDGIGFCSEMQQYPWNDYLLSFGPGVSFATFIGPVRLSYSWNFHIRASDPKTFLRFSIGFPF